MTQFVEEGRVFYVGDLWPAEWHDTTVHDLKARRIYIRTGGGSTVCWVYVEDNTRTKTPPEGVNGGVNIT